jgi:hypothetical protein
MSDTKKPKEPISFEHLGGTKVGHPVPVKAVKEIDFSSLGGKCVRKPNVGSGHGSGSSDG